MKSSFVTFILRSLKAIRPASVQIACKKTVCSESEILVYIPTIQSYFEVRSKTVNTNCSNLFGKRFNFKKCFKPSNYFLRESEVAWTGVTEEDGPGIEALGSGVDSGANQPCGLAGECVLTVYLR